MRNFQADIDWEGPLTATARSFHCLRGDTAQKSVEGIWGSLLAESSDVGPAQTRGVKEGEGSWVLGENHLEWPIAASCNDYPTVSFCLCRASSPRR